SAASTPAARRHWPAWPQSGTAAPAIRAIYTSTDKESACAAQPSRCGCASTAVQAPANEGNGAWKSKNRKNGWKESKRPEWFMLWKLRCTATPPSHIRQTSRIVRLQARSGGEDMSNAHHTELPVNKMPEM